MQLYTVGHSSRSFEEFTRLLADHRITLLVDVRSKPYSRWVPHFSKHYLETHLPMLYAWEPDLGGLTVVEPDAFERGIERLMRYAKRYTVCIVCSEKEHTHCHRFTKIQPALEERRVKVIHI